MFEQNFISIFVNGKETITLAVGVPKDQSVGEIDVQVITIHPDDAIKIGKELIKIAKEIA